MRHTRHQQPLPKLLIKRPAGKTFRPILHKDAQGILRIIEEMDVEGQGSTKRPAPIETPDRETQASNLTPCTLRTEIENPISKVEMSAPQSQHRDV